MPDEVRSRNQKYLASSKTSMMSLKDLQTKYAAMKTKSSLFEAPPKEDSQLQRQESFNSVRFNNSFRPKTAMSTLIQHDEGPMVKMSFVRNSNTLAEKINQQHPQDVRQATMQRVVQARKEAKRDMTKDFYSNSLRL